MKAIKWFFFPLMAIALSSTAFAQNLDKATVNKLINSKNFVFKAQTVLPMSMAARQLTDSYYDVKLWSDSLVSYLPYFGRSYTAVYGDEGGIKFTSTHFKYEAKKRKKGGWIISIMPFDTREGNELNFIVSENGSAYLQVNSNNRQSISFNGYIEKRK